MVTLFAEQDTKSGANIMEYMTRIIAGAAKGLTLAVPAQGTRPTSDRVRESLFAILEGELTLDDASVLDLFAGSGALGLEAISRGAIQCDFVDLGSAAFQSLNRNIAGILRRIPEARLKAHKKKASAFLEALADSIPIPAWDLVLIDPPYDLPAPQVHRVLDLLHPLIDEHTLVVLEESTHTPFGFPLGAYELDAEKRYGDTKISLLTKVG